MADTPLYLSTGLSPSWRTSVYAVLIALLVGIGLGAWGYHTWTHSDWQAKLHALELKLQAEKNKPPVVKETVKTETKTQLEYVPGETVYLPAATPGAPPVATKLDGKFTFQKPEFVYMVNGKPGKFVKADDERFVFDKNMLQLTQASTIRIEAEIPTVDKTKHGAIGLGIGSHGLAGKLDVKNAWLYVDKDTKAGGLQYRF